MCVNGRSKIYAARSAFSPKSLVAVFSQKGALRARRIFRFFHQNNIIKARGEEKQQAISELKVEVSK
jgi:hypothetical protein